MMTELLVPVTSNFASSWIFDRVVLDDGKNPVTSFVTVLFVIVFL